jgi:hypothetical protein
MIGGLLPNDIRPKSSIEVPRVAPTNQHTFPAESQWESGFIGFVCFEIPNRTSLSWFCCFETSNIKMSESD